MTTAFAAPLHSLAYPSDHSEEQRLEHQQKREEGGITEVPNISRRCSLSIESRRAFAAQTADSPRSAGPLHLFHDPIAIRLTAARAVMTSGRAIPPKNLWSLVMSNITSIEQDLYVRDAETYRPATFEEMLSAARRALAHRFRPGRSLRSPHLVEDYLRFALGSKEHEVFCLICLDTRFRLLGMIELFRGTVNAAQVHPREVVKESLRHNAAAVILAHNHPSGVSEPSSADELITQQVKSALALVDIQVLDHLIVSAHEVVSFVRRGLL